MAKNDLIGGSLWERYSSQVKERMNNPRHRGEISTAEAEALGAELVVAEWGAEACGDAVRLFWAVDPSTDRILDARFKSFGCGTAIASSDIMAELCIGKTVDQAVKITNIEVEQALRDEPGTPAVPPQKMHCSVMAYDVIKKAAAIYKKVDVTHFEEEEIVCECARVSLRTIRDAIRINRLSTVEEITNYTKAGAYCKSCIRPGGHEKRSRYLVDILKEAQDEDERRELRASIGKEAFSEMTLVQKLREIEKVLDVNVRPLLAADGGSLEVVDFKQDDAGVQVFIRYLGACRGCASSKTGTLSFIEKSLADNLDRSIRVQVV